LRVKGVRGVKRRSLNPDERENTNRSIRI
jgi:hypothetical protein